MSVYIHYYLSHCLQTKLVTACQLLFFTWLLQLHENQQDIPKGSGG